MNLKRRQAGFTIVELLLAMTFFSFILIFFSYGFVQINRTFQRGQTIKRVTQSGRAVIEDMSRNIRQSQFSTQPLQFNIVNDDVRNRLCLSNGVHYGWTTAGDATKEELLDDNGALAGAFNLVKTQASHVCTDLFVASSDSQQTEATEDNPAVTSQGTTSLLDDGVEIQNLDIELLPSNDAVRLDLTLSSDSVGSISTTGKNAVCNGFIDKGSEYCDVVRFVTIVNFRIN